MMLILYVQEMLGPDKRPTTDYLVLAWGLMFAVWLITAIYKTWFSKRRNE